MNPITKAFQLLDKTIIDKKELSKKLNSGKEFNISMADRLSLDPEDFAYKKNKENPLIWECIEKDHNNCYNVFLFRTENKYGNNGNAYRQVVLSKSELRKVLLKTDDIEMGITIEDSIKEPTENVWGYTFGNYRYYIIKDGVLTITESRSKIRKIYKGISIEKEKPFLIRIETDLTWYTKEVDSIIKLDDDIYECEFEDKKYILSNDFAIQEYTSKQIMLDDNRDYLIGMLGGSNNIIDMYLNGNTFDIRTYFVFNQNDMFNFLGIETQQYGDMNIKVSFSDIEIDNPEFELRNLKLYKKL